MIGLVQVGLQARADRYTYVPLIGLFLMAVWGVPDLLAGWRRRRTAMTAAAGLALVVCGALARHQVRSWKNDATLYQHALDVTADNFVAHNGMGRVLDRQGKLEEALVHFREAVRINPRYFRAQSNLGASLARSGNLEEAIQHLREALRLEPRYAYGHNNLGIALAIQGQTQEAVAHFSEALRIDPDRPMPTAIALALERQGDRWRAPALLQPAAQARERGACEARAPVLSRRDLARGPCRKCGRNLLGRSDGRRAVPENQGTAHEQRNQSGQPDRARRGTPGVPFEPGTANESATVTTSDAVFRPAGHDPTAEASILNAYANGPSPSVHAALVLTNAMKPSAVCEGKVRPRRRRGSSRHRPSPDPAIPGGVGPEMPRLEPPSSPILSPVWSVGGRIASDRPPPFPDRGVHAVRGLESHRGAALGTLPFHGCASSDPPSPVVEERVDSTVAVALSYTMWRSLAGPPCCS